MRNNLTGKKSNWATAFAKLWVCFCIAGGLALIKLVPLTALVRGGWVISMGCIFGATLAFYVAMVMWGGLHGSK